MKKLMMSVAISMFIFSSTSYAVDGYKGVKFGSSLSELKAAKLCSWKKWEGKQTKNLQSYYCQDFNFSGQNTIAFAVFYNDKFQRLAISINQNVDPVMKALTKKYGTPSSTSSQQDYQDVMKFGGSVFVKFDNNTVIVAGNYDVDTNKQTGQLIYSSPDYEQLLSKLQQESVENDL
ncbi:hypothetical protein [Pantoea ananatis]|uniref:hypothetical protein n=1 Tax=Pantoea ananas TaxID=553 RepID=UPI003CEAB5AB